jgi:hypothetical protein
MRATHVMAVACLLYVVARWGKGETAVDLQAVVGGLFAILVIALLDQGRTEEIARGFAWLFLAAAAYNAIPVIAKAAAPAATRARDAVTGG